MDPWIYLQGIVLTIEVSLWLYDQLIDRERFRLRTLFIYVLVYITWNVVRQMRWLLTDTQKNVSV